MARSLAAFAVLLTLAAVAETTTIEPIIDRPGIGRYCEVAGRAFGNAAISIDLLLSNAELEENPLWDEILAAHERGVRVRVVLDESDWATSITERNRPTLEYLVGHGIAARFDDPAVTTHAKLAIVDRTTVILGSTNWNRYAFADQEQANVRITNSEAGEAFSAWFEGIWSGRPPQAIPAEPSAAPTESRTILPLPDGDGGSAYAAAVLPLLHAADESIHASLYRLSVYAGYQDSTANDLVDALVLAARRGLDVRVLIDDCRFYDDSAAANLASALFLHERGIPVRFDDPEETTHTKLLLIDGKHVVLGSTNWNYYALDRNVEANVALLWMPDVAAIYEDYFETLWEDGRTIGP